MTTVLLQLSLCAVIVFHLTSSQSTDDITERQYNCERMEETYSQLMAAVSQLQRDVAEMKAPNHQKDVKECPVTFTRIESVNGCYKLVNRNREWSMAGLECGTLHKDAHLLVINNEAEQLAVAGMLASTNETTLDGCYAYEDQGIHFWTAGQRIDPTRCSPFIWRVASTSTYSETVSTMTYTKWSRQNPDCYQNQEFCMQLWSGQSYKWNDNVCSAKRCFVCEIDI